MTARSTGTRLTKAQEAAWDAFFLERGLSMSAGGRERDMRAAFLAGWKARKEAEYRVMIGSQRKRAPRVQPS